jgi:hypothetical protein
MKRNERARPGGKWHHRPRGRFIGLFLGVLLFLPAWAHGDMDTWVGTGGDDDWTTFDNWSLGLPPILTDFVTFNAGDSGHVSIVNSDFTIAGLRYMGNGIHTTDFAGSSNLQVDGPVYVGYGGSDNGATATWTNGGSVTIGDPANLQQFYVGYNGTAGGTNVSSLTIDGPDVDAYASTLAVAPNYSTGGTNSGLTLGDDSHLQVGAPGALANVRVGYNEGLDGSATGLLDASHGAADLFLYEMDVGYNKGPEGSAAGTLRWDQPDAISAEYVYFGRGPNATGALEVPAGGTFRLGTEAVPVGNLFAAYNNGGGSTSADLDLTTTDPTFEAHVSGTLGVGLNYDTGATDGKLVLGEKSTLNVGTPTTPAKATIGFNGGKAGTGTGLLDASQGTLTMHLNTLLVGDNNSGTPGALGSANGTLTTGEHTTITATTVHVARGDGTTGTVNMNGGRFAAEAIHVGEGGAFHFNDGRLTVNNFITPGGAGNLEQHGGILAPGYSRTETSLAGLTTISGGYLLDSPGILEIEMFGPDPALGYDQLGVFGPINLNADGLGGGVLDVKLDFAPEVGKEFVILDNYGADPIAGQFHDLAELATFDERFLDYLYTFQISYCAFVPAGNDVVLRVIAQTAVPAPGALVLAGLGMAGTGWLRRRRRL